MQGYPIHAYGQYDIVLMKLNLHILVYSHVYTCEELEGGRWQPCGCFDVSFVACCIEGTDNCSLALC